MRQCASPSSTRIAATTISGKGPIVEKNGSDTVCSGMQTEQEAERQFENDSVVGKKIFCGLAVWSLRVSRWVSVLSLSCMGAVPDPRTK